MGMKEGFEESIENCNNWEVGMELEKILRESLILALAKSTQT